MQQKEYVQNEAFYLKWLWFIIPEPASEHQENKCENKGRVPRNTVEDVPEKMQIVLCLCKYGWKCGYLF